jgi:hypothetical protein
MMLYSLRLIGNSCADTGIRSPDADVVSISTYLEIDANRARVISQNYTLPIIKQLRNPGLAKIAVLVIYNICVDYGMPLLFPIG